MALDGNTFFTFQVHVIQHLRLHIPVRYGMGKLQQAVCQGTFTVVNMGYDTEIPNILHIFKKKCKGTVCFWLKAAVGGIELEAFT